MDKHEKYGPKGIRPSGLILAHNQVRRYVNSPHGANGFRRWYDWPPGSNKKSRHFDEKLPDYVICNCGWRPDLGVHYRIKGLGSLNYRCDYAPGGSMVDAGRRPPEPITQLRRPEERRERAPACVCGRGAPFLNSRLALVARIGAVGFHLVHGSPDGVTNFRRVLK